MPTVGDIREGIIEGQKMITTKVGYLGTKVNGWIISGIGGVYGYDYLGRAAVAKIGTQQFNTKRADFQ